MNELTTREYIATQILSSLIANIHNLTESATGSTPTPSALCYMCLGFTDELITQLDKTSPK